MRRVGVERRIFPHQGVHIGDRHQNSDLPVRERFGDRELIQVAGIVVVNGRPEPVTQVTQGGCLGRSDDGRQLLRAAAGKSGSKPPSIMA